MNIKEQFFLVDWDTEIVDSNIKDIKKDVKLFGNITSDAVMKWTLISDIFIPIYKKSRSVNKRSNALRVLHYHFAKFIYYHELFYGRNPKKSTYISPSLVSLNVTRIKKSGLPLEMIIELGESIYKNYEDSQI